MQNIKKQRFEALAGYSRLPHAIAISKELEWYASKDEILLATILIDYDGEYISIVLGRDTDMRYRCIECLAAFKNIETARKALISKAKEIIGSSQKIFPQGDERGKKLDIFEPIHKKEKLNPSFELVRTLPGYLSAKEIISEAMHHYIDIDGNFVEQFQTTGFDARLWELYLFAYLTEEHLLIDRSNYAPDFLISDGSTTAAIEAVTVQASPNDPVEELDIEKMSPQKIQELQRHHMPIKFGSSLYSKLKKKYWELPHVQGRPLVFAIADFHAKQSMLWSSTALSNYLYGNKHDFNIKEDGTLIISPIKIDYHERRGKKIPSGFFFTENSEHISAIISSSSGTISKFIRMGKIAGFGNNRTKIIYSGTNHKHDKNSALPNNFFFEIDSDYEESWAAGLSVFHNPNALIPLDRNMLLSAAHHFWQPDGQISSFLPEFHPYGGITLMLQESED
jgi:hypothetical protein